jgi:MSHA pilin protein MshA
MKIFNKKQSGFTLVELVVVVAVVGVLAVVATPKIMDVAGDARQATLNGIAGALTAATTRNFAQRSARNDSSNIAMLDCNTADDVLEGGLLPDGYEITTKTLLLTGAATACTISTTTTPVRTATFDVRGIE